MPGFPQLDAAAVNAIVQFVVTGQDAPAGRGGGARGNAPSRGSAATAADTAGRGAAPPADTVAGGAPVPPQGRGRGGPTHPLINNTFRFTGYRKFLDPDGYPATAPPWGTLNAINLNTGEYAWKIPLGEYPELVQAGLKDTGSENYGGPIVTAGGLVFIAATNHDRKIRAFDKATGALLWEATMPSSGNATPATYESRSGGPGGVYVAFALPRP